MGKKFVCDVSDVPVNGMKAFVVEGHPEVLVLHSGEEYFAYQAMCPHQEVALEDGLYDGCVLTCHQHLWQWDVKTGEAMGLAEAPLEYYEVEIDGGSVYIASPSALKMAELFKGVSDTTLERIDNLARREAFEAGSALYRVGDAVEDLYVLESGCVEFLIGRDDRTSQAGFMLRKGEVFGWAALLENQSYRIATAACVESSSVLRINGKQILTILEADPASGYLVMRRLSSSIAKYLTSAGAT